MIIENRLMNIRCKLISDEPWYGTIASMMHWVCRVDIKTMGVNMTNDGRVYCIYSPDFIKSLSNRGIYNAIKHEIEHLVRLHPLRGHGRLHKIHNIAADMLINGHKNNKKIIIDKIPIVYMPSDVVQALSNDPTTEEVYDYLMKHKVKFYKLIEMGSFDNHDVWSKSNIGIAVGKQIIEGMCKSATSEAGKVPGHLASAINALKVPTVNWKSQLKRIVGRSYGSRRATFSRPSRRNPKFGIKGKSNRASIPITILVDTSGSVSEDDLCTFFSEIEAMSSMFKITIQEFDADLQGPPYTYHRGDWRKIKPKGRGGTNFHTAFEGAEQRKIISKMNIVLTDAGATIPDEKPYNVLWAVIGNYYFDTIDWGEKIKVGQIG